MDEVDEPPASKGRLQPTPYFPTHIKQKICKGNKKLSPMQIKLLTKLLTRDVDNSTPLARD